MDNPIIKFKELSKFYDLFVTKIFSKKFRKTVSTGPADEKIELFAQNIKDIRELFFNNCLEIVSDCSSYDIELTNRKIGGKAELVISVFQLILISELLPRYIEPSEEKDFNELLMELTCRRHYRKCHDFVESYKQLEKSISNKKIFFISVDIAKYLYGHSSTEVPSSFPCLTSYISNGLSTQIVDRLSITESALLIASIIPKITDATTLALAHFFDDEESAREIESQLESPPDPIDPINS